MNAFRLRVGFFIISFFIVSFQVVGQSCTTPFIIDWDNVTAGTDPRNSIFSAADVDVEIQSIDIYGHVSDFSISNRLQGTNNILWEQTIDNANEFAVATFKFSRPTKDFVFTVFDVDAGNFVDSLTINGYSDGTLVNLNASNVTTSASNSFIGNNTVRGDTLVTDASSDGNVSFFIPQTIDSLVFLYNNNTAPSLQVIGIHDFSWCGADSDYDQVLNIDDTDDDNDGLSDIIEGGGVDPGADEDGDDIPNYLDTDYSGFVDNNGDGISDNFDTDLDGIPNHLDRDIDNDGIPDAVEANGGVLPANMSSDGRYSIAYAQANDSDGDGLVDDIDPDTGTPFSNPDTDGDFIADIFDLDSDGDGIPDIIEVGGVDTDQDGRVDNFEDRDNDGLADIYDITIDGNALVIRNTENDALPDYRDIDSDADGILDNVEAQPSGTSFRNSSGTDTDGDGIDDAFDVDNAGAITFQDTDGDGLQDFIDGDSDGDGIRDFIEGHDPDMDGERETFPVSRDTDGDGLDDGFDLDHGGTAAVTQNTDGDILPDYRDSDDDNDGILTVNEDFNGNNFYEDDFTQGGNPAPDYLFQITDPDGDNLDNNLDIDDNNDGISDIEQGFGIDPGADADTDGTPNYLDIDFVHPTLGVFTDVNGDGVNDIFDADRDGVPNHFDLDNDNDGIPNAFEANGGSYPANVDDNGQFLSAYVSANDSDGDGLVNDTDASTGGTALSTDTDGDGIDDYLDQDSDGDGISDAVEANASDSNGDGINDIFANNDTDSLPNYIDFDSDGDGISDLVEGLSTSAFTNPAGTDTDGDGLDDNFDADNGGVNIDPNDHDSDGIPDYLDTDSDNDTVLDVIEGHDTNQDGVADRTASGADTDNDGLDNAFDVDNGGTSAPIQNTDLSNGVDFRDNDDDGDGIPTRDEIVDISPANGTSDYLEATTDICGNQTVSISGNAVTVALVNSVTNSTNSLGAPDFDGADNTTFSIFGTLNGFYILDMQEFLPGGTEVTVALFANNGAAFNIFSSNLTSNFGFSGFVNNSGGGVFANITYTVPAQGSRYIGIVLNGTATGAIFVDALSYSICIGDVDNDGIADRIDLDDDNDGIPDLSEATAYSFDPSADDDMDGQLNYEDTTLPGFTDENIDGVDDRVDSDLDGIPNHLDLDSDNDGIVDVVEANQGVLPANAASDGRYVASYVIANDSDGDGLVNDVDGFPLVNGDFDFDGINDIYDLDSDNDGITDLVEAGGVDIDGDGALDNFLDTDGDGLGDSVDPDNGGTALAVWNSDGTDNPDYIDRDSDDDGIEDIIEGHDANNDGIAEWDVDNNQFLDVSEGSADSNNNGIPDAFDRSLGGIIAALPDSDNDGLLNFRDTDDDGDGVLTSLEDANGNGDFSDDFTNGQQGANAGLPNYLFNQFTVLPVELISFSGEWIDSKVELRWATATEINNDRFEVERSHDAINFITLGVVNGRGNSSTINEYEYRDNNPLSGISYYRLKQVDFDGAFEYSEIVRVESQVTFDNLKFSVFPNPARSIDNLNIQLITYAPELPLNLRILDTNGTVIRTLENIDIPFSDKLTLGVQELKLKSGVYLIQVTQQRKTAVYRVLIL